MKTEKLIQDIDLLIENSKFYMYDSEKRYLKSISRLKKLKKLLEEGKCSKVLSEKGDDNNES